MVKSGCFICQQELEYLTDPVEMTCALCKRQFTTLSRCPSGHYICDKCHSSGLSDILQICQNQTSIDPISIFNLLISLPFCHMHGPEHHVLVGASLLTAYKNSGGDIDLGAAILEMMQRGQQVPGGACGFWGACGAGISCGIFVSIITKATPLSGREWSLSNKMTSLSLEKISSHGGPRCCKRDSYLAISAAIDFVRDHFGITMGKSAISCNYSMFNKQCLKENCPFNNH